LGHLQVKAQHVDLEVHNTLQGQLMADLRYTALVGEFTSPRVRVKRKYAVAARLKELRCEVADRPQPGDNNSIWWASRCCDKSTH
jgi:hypothetical protein